MRRILLLALLVGSALQYYLLHVYLAIAVLPAITVAVVQ